MQVLHYLLLLHSALTPSKYASTTPSCLLLITLHFSISKILYFSYHKIFNVLRSSNLPLCGIKMYLFSYYKSVISAGLCHLSFNYLYSCLLKNIVLIHDSLSMAWNIDIQFTSQYSAKYCSLLADHELRMVADVV